MRSLSKGLRNEYDRILGELSAAAEAYTDGEGAGDAEGLAARRVAFDRYAVALKDAVAFAETVAAELRDYADARSERWHESEIGDEFSTWQRAWEDFCPDTDLDAHDLCDDGMTAFEGLPLEIG